MYGCVLFVYVLLLPCPVQRKHVDNAKDVEDNGTHTLVCVDDVLFVYVLFSAQQGMSPLTASKEIDYL